MMRRPSLLRLLVCSVFTFLVGPEPTTADDAVSFSRTIAPILQRNCIACHREKRSEGGLSLESKEAIRAGGDSGDLLVAGSPDESLLYLRAGDEYAPMPPEGNTVGAKRLTPSEMEFVRAWIAQGADIDADVAAVMIDWQPIPESVRSSFAIASSPDHRFLAVGRANRVELVKPETGVVTQRLTDDALDQSGLADVDVIQAIAVSPLGDRIATGGFRTVRIWERQPVEVTTPQAVAGAFGSGAVNPERTEVAMANPIGDVAVREPDGDETRLLITGYGPVADINWEHAETIAVGRESGDVQVFSASDGSIAVELKLDHPIDRLARSRDGRFMAVLDVRGRVRLFDQHTPKTLKAIDSITDASVISFLSPMTLVAGTDSGQVILVDPVSDRVVHRLEHRAPVTSLAANPSGSVLASGGRDGQAKVWNTADASLLQTLRGDARSRLQIASLEMAVQREKSWLESLEKETESLQKRLENEKAALAKLNEAREQALGELKQKTEERDQIAAQIEQTKKQVGAEQPNLKKQQEQLAATETEVQAKKTELDKRDQAIATAKATRDRAAAALPKHDDDIRARNNRLAHLEQRSNRLAVEVASSPAIAAMAFDDAEQRLVIADQNGTVRTFDIASGKPLDRFETIRWPEITSPSSAASIAEGRVIISHRNGPATVIPTKQRWTLKRTIGGPHSDRIADRVTALDFASDGQTLAIGSGTPSRNGQLLLVAPGSGAVMRRFDEVHSDAVLCLRFSPDDRTICSASADKTIRLIHVDNGEVMRTLDGHTHHVLSVAWKRDGRTIASGSADGTVKAWDVESGQQTRTIGGFPDEVTSVEFLGDSPQLVSSCADGQIRIHDTGNGQQLRAASASDDSLFTVGVSPDGSHVFAAGQQGTLHAWTTADLKPVASW